MLIVHIMKKTKPNPNPTPNALGCENTIESKNSKLQGK
jgi:hypothetical protein